VSFQDVSAPSATQGFAPGTGGCLAIELSTTLVDTKQFGIEFNSNLKTGTKTGGGHFEVTGKSRRVERGGLAPGSRCPLLG
jgi:hypothetical protein